MTDFIRIEDRDRIRTIRFNRADKKNAITRDMYTAMAEGLENANKDDTRVVIIAGTENCFTAGNDMVDFMQHPPHFGDEEVSPVERFMRALAACEKPVIAAVDGLAIGIGTTLLLHCDLAYASERASFKTPFVDLALAPEYGSSQVLPGIVGRVVATDLLINGAIWDGQRAKECFLINDVISADQLETHVRQAALRIAQKAPGAVKAAKALLQSPPEDLYDRITREGKMFADMLQSEEFKEAATAFMERRDPDFSRFG